MLDLEKNKKTIMELIFFSIVVIFLFINMSYIWTFNNTFKTKAIIAPIIKGINIVIMYLINVQI